MKVAALIVAAGRGSRAGPGAPKQYRPLAGEPVLRLSTQDGIEAVIDKDAASALLARELGADALLLLTDVDAVYRGFGTGDEAAIGVLTPDEARALDLPAGSMGPKVRAAADFASRGGLAGIGRLDQAVAILNRQTGTMIMQMREQVVC